MKYNSMTIHCASLCLDVLSQRHFFSYTIPDILAFKPEVICQIGVRLEPVSKELTDERGMTEVLAGAVISVLLQYHFTRRQVSADLIMELIQHRLDEFLFKYKS